MPNYSAFVARLGARPTISSGCGALIAALIAVMLVSSASAVEQARNVRFTRLGLDQGLSQEAVYDVTQDRHGFMWFATQEGLNRYDGQEFVTYLHDEQDPGSLAHDWVWTVFEDRAGSLWVGTDGGGVSRMAAGSNHFVHIKAEDKDSGLANNHVRVIHQDNAGQMWFGTDGGLSRLDPISGAFEHFSEQGEGAFGLSGNRVRAIVQGLHGNLWIGTDGGGLNQMDIERGTFRHFRYQPDTSNGISSDRVRSLYQSADGMLWIGTYDGGLNRYNPRTGVFRSYTASDETGLESDFIRELIQDHRGVLWVATDEGFHEYRPESDTFVAYRHDSSNSTSLSDDRVISLFQDSGNVLWLGTYAGISKWNYQTVAFRLFRTGQNVDQGLRSNTIFSFAEGNDGDVWVGTYEGLHRLDSKSGQVDWFGAEHGLSDQRIMAIQPLGGSLWLGTRSAGLERLDLATGAISHYPPDPEDSNALAVGGVTMLRSDREGRLWVGTFGGGVYQYQPDTDDFTAYRSDSQDLASLPSDRVISLLPTRNGELWVGTFGSGVARLDPQSNKFHLHSHEIGNTTSLSNDTVWVIHEDLVGNLWFGTQGGGLSYLESDQRALEKPTFRTFGRREGLPSQVIYGILEDERGDLWLSSNKGISRFSPANSSMQHFDVNHGLQAYEFNAGAFANTRQGELFFGGSNGFNAFFPSEVQPNQHPPRVAITRILKVNQPITNTPVHELDRLEVGAQDYLITFEFAALDFSAPQQNRYRYMLEGYDQDWIESDRARRASYTNLPSGTFQFRVQGSNNDGVWNEDGAGLQLTVRPPFYLSGWAYFGYAFLLAILAAGLYWLHLRRLEQEAARNRQLESEVEQRTSELARRSKELKERYHDLQRANKELEDASFTDTLSGLHNRRFVSDYLLKVTSGLDREWEKMTLNELRTNGRRIFLLILDLDHFEAVNNLYGHAFGDRVIQDVAAKLTRDSRTADVVARWGGNEFILVGETHSDQATMLEVVDRILKSVTKHEHRTPDNTSLKLGCSAGVAFYPFSIAQPHLFNWTQVMRIAERSLSLSKESGRGSWACICSGELGLVQSNFNKILSNPLMMAESRAIQIEGPNTASFKETIEQFS